MAAAKRPNIIFLMDDQHRWDHLGIVDPGVKTPHLDRLARQGIHFDQAACQAPMCIASRYSMMTGLYPSQVGVRMNEFGPADEDMPAPVLPELLRDAGYQTAGFGKTHWTHPNCSTRGFEVRVIQHGRKGKGVLVEQDALMMPDEAGDAFARHNEECKDYGKGEENVNGYIGCTSALAEDDHPDGWLLNKSLEFLDTGVDRTRPLFFYLSFVKPHAGLNIPAGYEDLYDLDAIDDIAQPEWTCEPPGHSGPEQFQEEVNKDQAEHQAYWPHASSEARRLMRLRYRANCSWMDSMFGRALAELEEKGLLDNSLIVYASDHGDMLGERFWRFHKFCMYDPSVKVPLILGGSAVPEALRGTTDSRPAELVDLLPTLLAAAAIEYDAGLPGASLLEPPTRVGSFCEYHGNGYWYPRGTPSYMWRTADWKLILYLEGPLDGAVSRADGIKGELYDLQHDPREWENLFYDDAHAALRERMTRELLMHVALTHARRPRTKWRFVHGQGNQYRRA